MESKKDTLFNLSIYSASFSVLLCFLLLIGKSMTSHVVNTELSSLEKCQLVGPANISFVTAKCTEIEVTKDPGQADEKNTPESSAYPYICVKSF